jgi:hypothetical protein
MTLALVTGPATQASAASSAAPSAAPTQKVVLLSSLNTAYIHVPFYLFFMRHYFRTYERKLAARFRGFFAPSGYEVEVRLSATQADLWQALHDPRNVGVFWVSHAAGAVQETPGLASNGEIADLDGFDVTPAFQQLHPNLRFLGVVGCQSAGAIHEMLAAHHAFDVNPWVKVEAFDYKVDAKRGLSQMMWKSDEVLSRADVTRGYPASCPRRYAYPMTITRHVAPGDLYVPAARIELGGQVLGVFGSFDPAKTGRPAPDASVTVHLEHALGQLEPFELKLVENAGENPSATRDDIELGSLELGAPWPGAGWKLFADNSGRAVGVTSHIYRYAGTTELATQPVEYEPFECEAMPALEAASGN